VGVARAEVVRGMVAMVAVALAASAELALEGKVGVAAPWASGSD
jgi:hypothetical protein